MADSDQPFRMQHTDKSFSVNIFGWNSPRLVAFVDGFVYFQASTCYPCPVCHYRVETLKRALETGPHARAGLWGNEVLLNLDGQRTYNLVKVDGQVFVVLPYAGEDDPGAIAAFLSRMLQISASVAGGPGEPMQVPVVSHVYGLDRNSPSQAELLAGVAQLQGRLRDAAAADEFTKRQARNRYLLIAALVLNEMNVETAFDSLVEFAEAYPEEERRLFRSHGGVGGLEARRAEAVLHGYYYNTDTILYLVDSSAVPFVVASRVKEAYDLTICSHLNEDLDLGERYSNTAYHRLLTSSESQGAGDTSILAQELPPEVKKALSRAPSTLDSDAEKAAWLYSLEDPGVYRALSRSLFDDKEDELRSWMPLILLIKQYADSHPVREEVLTYRSSGITDSQFDALRMHAVYRDPKFVSMTQNSGVAADFSQLLGNKYMCEFKIRKDCTNAVMLQVSQFADEKEVLLTPYSPLLVIGKDKEKKLVRFAVLGDEAAKKHLETGEGRNSQGLPWGYG